MFGLFDDLEIVQDGQYKAGGDVDVDQSACKLNEDSEDWNDGKQIEYKTDHSAYNNVNKNVDYQGGNILFVSKGIRENFLQSLHDDITPFMVG